MINKGQISGSLDPRFKRFVLLDNWALLFIPVICLIIFASVFENDTFWLINTGKFIIENGFPVTDPFTMHSGLRLTVQQWLTTVVFYKLYAAFGDTSILILCLIAFMGISFIMYYTYLIVDESSKHFAITTIVFTTITLGFYILPRPQIFSILIFSLEILLLEMYVKKGIRKILLLLPVLSVLLINFHAAMWVVFFLLFVPYIIDGLNFSIFGIKSQNYGIKDLIFAFSGSLAAGFINPYGINNILYLVSSYGNGSIKTFINEMKSPNFQTGVGILFFIILVVIALVYSRTNGIKTIRNTLLCIGTAYLGLSSTRSFVFFLICAVPLVAHSLKGLVLPESHVNKRIVRLIVTTLTIVTVLVIVTKDYKQDEYLTDFKPAGAAEYIKSNINMDKMILYNDFNVGGYLEYSGIRTFIDSRAELFTKEFNKKEDIFEDYADVLKGKTHYKDFQSKYSFTHFLIYKGDLLDTYLAKDSEYKVVYEDKKFVLYERDNLK